jgi:hypothetical protein
MKRDSTAGDTLGQRRYILFHERNARSSSTAPLTPEPAVPAGERGEVTEGRGEVVEGRGDADTTECKGAAAAADERPDGRPAAATATEPHRPNIRGGPTGPQVIPRDYGPGRSSGQTKPEYTAASGQRDHATFGSGPTRQSDERDSEQDYLLRWT